MAAKRSPKTETFTVSGNNLVDSLKQVIAQGNIRRVIVKNKSCDTLAQFSLTLGVIGGVLAPILAAGGLIAALVTECCITVEKK